MNKKLLTISIEKHTQVNESESHCSIIEVFNEACVMKGARQCVVDHLRGESFTNWVQCSRCYSWYHCDCVGTVIDGMTDFVCCHNSVKLMAQKCKNYYKLRAVIIWPALAQKIWWWKWQ